MGRLDQLGDAVRQTIRAFHGSPYDFDRFDASKIGTGEGAQAYGHGMYFAGNEGVARDYRDRLKDFVDGPVPDELGDELQGVIHEIRGLAERRNAAKGDEWTAIAKALDDAHARHQDVQHRIRAASYNPGRMYEVEIAHPESSLLDWDRPVHEQPDQVYDALGWSANNPLFDTLGREGWTGRRAYYKMAEELGGSDKAAKSLLDNGVPGIRYLDQGSRRAGEGTRNYVVFPGTEDSIRILRKFAVPGAVGAGAASLDGQPE